MDSIKDVLPFLSNNLYGLRTEDGDTLVEPYFTKIEIVNDFAHPMMKATFPDGGVGYIAQLTETDSAKVLIPINHADQYRQCYLTKKGSIVLTIKNIGNKYWVFSSIEDRRYGIMDSRQTIIVNSIFDWFTSANDYAIWLVKNDNRTNRHMDFIFINSMADFSAQKQEIFDYYTEFPDVYIYYDTSRNKIVIPNFDDSHNIVSGNVWFLEGGYFGLMSADGRIIIEPTFDLVRVRANGLADVIVKGLYAVLDNDGNQIIKFTSCEIVNQRDNEYLLWKNENEFVIRKVKNKSYWSK